MKMLKKISCVTMSFVLLGILTYGKVWAQEVEMNWRSFEEAIELAEEQGKPILVDVWAPWCGWCKKMQNEVYPELSEMLNKEFILTRLNRDDNETKKEFQGLSLTPLRLAQKLKIRSVPAIVFLSPNGNYEFHISGFIDTDELERVLEYAVSNVGGQKKIIGPED